MNFIRCMMGIDLLPYRSCCRSIHVFLELINTTSMATFNVWMLGYTLQATSTATIQFSLSLQAFIRQSDALVDKEMFHTIQRDTLGHRECSWFR